MGSTELLFELPNDQEDTQAKGQTLVLEAPISREASISAMSQMVTHQRSQDMLDLYQLSICLIRCTSPDEVAATGLEMLRVRTQSTAVGFLWIDDQGELKPQLVVPPGLADRFRLHKKLTQRVSREGRAVWVKDRIAGTGQEATFADAICVPLMSDTTVMGAIHLYREEGKFEKEHFDFAISAGNMLAVALESSRAQASLSAEHQRLRRTADFCRVDR
ncbi:MAG: GAF domain-containing protein [Pirellulaceae bacterium]